jgi:hypothetical protein
MVCSQDPDARARQVETLLGHADPGLAAELSRLQRWIDRLDPAAFLPLAELCVRALRQLSPPQYEAFRTLLQELIEEDREIDLFEYMLQRMIVRHLDPLFRPARRTPVQYYTLNTLLPDCAVLLSGLARVGHGDEATAAQAFKVGAAQLAPDSALTLLAFGECNLPQMDEALSRLSQATPRLRQQLLASLLLVVATDGQVNRREAELLRAVSDALDLPAPPFLTAAEAAARDAAPA